jgi:hypothetical protein
MKKLFFISALVFTSFAPVLAEDFQIDKGMKRFEITYYLPTLSGAQRVVITAEGGFAAVKIVESMFPGARVSSSYREVK